MALDGLEELSRSAEIRTQEARTILFAYDTAATKRMSKDVYAPLAKQHPELAKDIEKMSVPRGSVQSLDELSTKMHEFAGITSQYAGLVNILDGFLVEKPTERDLKEMAEIGLNLNIDELKSLRNALVKSGATFEIFGRLYKIEDQVLYNRLTAIKALAKEKNISPEEAAGDFHEVIRRTFASKGEALQHLQLRENVSSQLTELLQTTFYLVKLGALGGDYSPEQISQAQTAKSMIELSALSEKPMHEFWEREYTAAFASRPKRKK